MMHPATPDPIPVADTLPSYAYLEDRTRRLSAELGDAYENAARWRQDARKWRRTAHAAFVIAFALLVALAVVILGA